MAWTTPDENAAFLRGALIERLLRRASEQVLDVGCGRGELLACCRAAGLSALGLEADPQRAAALRAGGDAVLVGRAEQLPFSDRAVPWVVMRHAAHHLSDPERGVRELARVALLGVVVAEPWRPIERPDQATALAIDLWSKAHDRRRGHDHHSDVPAEQLVSWLQSAGDFDVDVAEVVQPAQLAAEQVASDLEQAVADLLPDAALRREIDDWLELAESTGVGATGSTIVVALRS
jgi:SAM-dependent methyltransferase